MTAHPIQATVDGDTVTMPRAEFERIMALLDDAEEVMAFDAVQRRLAAGADEPVPASIADRLFAGENPIRVWREYRGLTLEALAAAAGATVLGLEQIEAGQREPTLTEGQALAAALGVERDDLT